MDGSTIAVGEGGLSRDQVSSILATKFPPEEPVSVSIFYLFRDENIDGYDPLRAIVAKLKELPFIDRIVIVPRILYGTGISLDRIQQIGVRSLSEYSIVFFSDAENVFFSYKSPAGTYIVSSTLEFMLVDNRTTAIIATDTLFSEFDTTFELFSDKAYRESLDAMYAEQTKLLNAKLTTLFSRR